MEKKPKPDYKIHAFWDMPRAKNAKTTTLSLSVLPGKKALPRLGKQRKILEGIDDWFYSHPLLTALRLFDKMKVEYKEFEQDGFVEDAYYMLQIRGVTVPMIESAILPSLSNIFESCNLDYSLALEYSKRSVSYKKPAIKTKWFVNIWDDYEDDGENANQRTFAYVTHGLEHFPDKETCMEILHSLEMVIRENEKLSELAGGGMRIWSNALAGHDPYQLEFSALPHANRKKLVKALNAAIKASDNALLKQIEVISES